MGQSPAVGERCVMVRRALSGVGGAVVADTSMGTVAVCDRCFQLLKADSGLAAFL